MGSISFKLNGGGDVSGINVTKKPIGGSEPMLVVAIKITGNTTGGILTDLFGCQAEDITGFWRQDIDNNPVFSGITKITSWADFPDHKMKLSRKTYNNVQLHDFVVKPAAGLTTDVWFTATMTSISESEVENLVGNLKSTVACSVEGPLDLLKGV